MMVGIRLEGDLGAGLLAGLAGLRAAALGERPCGTPAPRCSLVAPDFELQQFRKRVHAAHAHAVQAARNFVAVGIELAAGVQLGHHDLRRRDAFFLCISTGMPRPLSTTVTELSMWMVTLTRSQ